MSIRTVPWLLPRQGELVHAHSGEPADLRIRKGRDLLDKGTNVAEEPAVLQLDRYGWPETGRG
jgi:hypothetical protein